MEKKNNVIPLNQKLKEKFKQIELSLDLLSHNYGPQSLEVDMARDQLNDGDIEAAYHSLSSTDHYLDQKPKFKSISVSRATHKKLASLAKNRFPVEVSVQTAIEFLLKQVMGKNWNE